MKDTKGSVKETIGRKTGNKELQADGMKDQARGKGQKAVGETKKAVDK